MDISDERLREFIAIAREDYGVELTPEEAMVHAKRLLLLYELIYRPLPEERAQKAPPDAFPPAA